MTAKTYDLTTREGLLAYGDLVGHDLARATRFGMAYGMGAVKLRERIRDDVLCFARAALYDDTLPETAVGAFSAADRAGIVFG